MKIWSWKKEEKENGHRRQSSFGLASVSPSASRSRDDEEDCVSFDDICYEENKERRQDEKKKEKKTFTSFWNRSRSINRKKNQLKCGTPASQPNISYAKRSTLQSIEVGGVNKGSATNILTLDPVREITQHTRCITAIRISSNSSSPYIVTAGLDCMVFVTDFYSGLVLKKIDTDLSFVFSLTISADDSVFATASQDGCVRIYSRTFRWKCMRKIPLESPGVCRIVWAVELYTTLRGDNLCIAAGATKVIHVFDWETGKEGLALSGHREGVRCLAVAADGTLASGSNDFTVRLCKADLLANLISNRRNVISGKFLFTLRGHSAEVNALVFIPNSSSLVTACEGNIFRVWNYVTGARLIIFDGYRGLSILSMSAIPNAHYAPWVLVGGSHIKGSPYINVEVWNIETGDKVADFRGCRYQINGIDVRCVLSEDGSESFVAVAGGLDCKLRCWNLDALLANARKELDEREIIIDVGSITLSDRSL